VNFEEKTLTVDVNKDDHVWGTSDAPVTLIEYGDYECPYCGQAYPIVRSIQDAFGPKKIRFVFRNFPLTNMHPHAELAAEAAEAAAEQNKFWEMHDAIYENQGSLGAQMLLNLAKEIKLDEQKFMSAIETKKFKDRIKKDFMSGVESDVNGTPSFFINGARFDGDWSQGGLTQAIKQLLSK
jgi:protein-disulfide isomerase